MEKAQKAVEAVTEGVKKVAIGEKKPKVKKEKGGGDGGADTGKCPELYVDRRLIFWVGPLEMNPRRYSGAIQSRESYLGHCGPSVFVIVLTAVSAIQSPNSSTIAFNFSRS